MWARRKALRIVRKAVFGPRAVFVNPNGMLLVPARRISFSTVESNPSGDGGSSSQSKPAGLIHESGHAISKPASDSIPSPVTEALVTRSYRSVDVGDIVILEEGERLSDVESKGICLVSVLRVTHL
ncbi:hypothetical protein B0I35DRAFT_442647 [Stachybotrys elegans]|uniref:Uncharacterized protein n=1 Tax=Stachybotrys elegans TaxID=80388 RepID=A0A8K0SH49_9HYPO|nr:hypothetical protein B0I35DRAFT_442647 [Stachybotrys elegans]